MRALQFILLLILSLAYPGFAQYNLYFTYLTVEQGLPGYWVRTIAQDHYGFIWIGTLDAGLSRYDGYGFKTYRSTLKDSSTLSHTSITAIHEDSDHNLWVGTSNGLNLYIRKSDKFKRFFVSPTTAEQPATKPVNVIFEDSWKRLWIGGNVLRRFHKSDSTFSIFAHSPNEPNSVGDGSIKSIVEDQEKHLWFSTKNALNLYDEASDNFKRYPLPAEIHNKVSSLCIDHQGRFWVGTYGNGLWLFTPEDGTYINYYDSININGDYNEFIEVITKVFQDSKKNIWIATDGSGLCYLDPEAGQLYVHSYNPFLNGALSDNNLLDIFEDRDKILWIACYNSGISIFDTHQSNFRRYFYNPTDAKSISSNLIIRVYEDTKGNLWFASDGGGINHLVLEKDGRIKSNTSFRHIKQNPMSLLSDKVGPIFEDSEGWMWVGHERGGATKFHPLHGEFLHFKPGKNETDFLYGTKVRAIHQDRNGDYWFGTNTALYYLNKKTLQFHHYSCNVSGILEATNGTIWVWDLTEGLKIVSFEDRKLITVVHGSVFAVVEDQEGILYVATTNKGLLKYNPHTSQLVKLNLGKRFLTDDWPRGLLMDSNGYLWTGTRDGVIRIDPETRTMINFGLLEETLKHYNWPLIQTSDGLIYFKGPKGVIAFHSDSIKEQPAPPPALFTKFQLFNRDVPIDEVSVMKPDILETKEIELNYKQDVFTIEYASLSFKPDQTHYAYKMEGYDQDWRDVGTVRTATYTNLDASTYNFKVRAGNQNGIWNEQESSLIITILPPPWKTWWAYTLYGIMALSILLIWRQNLVRRVRLNNKLQLEHLELEKVKEMDQLKTSFFTNISHEFRTPLTLILGPLKQMYEGTFKGDPHTVIAVMIRNSKRLLNLINQLLDFSKLEAGAVSLQTSEEDIVNFSRTLFSAFESTARNRNISYEFQSNQSSIVAYYDHDKLEKVIVNLLSNAFKFTEEGFVHLRISSKAINPSVDKGEGVVEMRFEDSGSGIPADKLPHIFDRFYQADPSSTRRQEGTGIGLALAKELVELHSGTIDAPSKQGEGTTFIVHLPLGRSHLSDAEVVFRKAYESFDLTALAVRPENLPDLSDVEHTNMDLPLLLIIDDNEDMRMYLREVLSGIYHLVEASNGVKGWEYAIEHIPDLIVSDVMMPEMDGHELCWKLKTDVRTCHIPVVLLTARAGEEAKVEGLETGADDYITKPFSPVELKARIQNLIELRQKLREQFSRDPSILPKGATITSIDERFMERALKLLEIHRSDADYSVEAYAKDIGMSRSQLHRKFKALTDQTTSEFIRSYRLKYARQLIKKEFGNMAQIAYECGFNNPSYFAECFKKQFGIVPSKYSKMNE